MKRILLITTLFIITIVVANAQARGYEKSIEFSGLFEIKKNILPLKNVSALNLNFVNGFRANDYFFIGGGIGVDYSTWESLGHSQVFKDYSASIPVFIRAKANFTKTTISPFISFDLGYNFMIGSSDDYVFDGISKEFSYKRSGVFISPTIGADFKINDNNSVYVGLSYLLSTFSENKNSYSHNVNSIGFRLGWDF